MIFVQLKPYSPEFRGALGTSPSEYFQTCNMEWFNLVDRLVFRGTFRTRVSILGSEATGVNTGTPLA